MNAASRAYAPGLPDEPPGALHSALMLALAALDSLRDVLLRQKRVCPYRAVGAALDLTLLPLAPAEVRDARARQR